MKTAILTKQQVFDKIITERAYQDRKWGADKPQSLPGYLLILQREVQEAIDGWMKDSSGRDAPLNEILQVAAVAVACLEQYGTEGSATPTLDIPDAGIL
jgi:hypothetical protein